MDADALLVTITGLDRPGVTARVCAALAAVAARILDIEQVVIRERLILGFLVSCDGAEQAAIAAVQTRWRAWGWRWRSRGPRPTSRVGSTVRHTVTVLGQPAHAGRAGRRGVGDRHVRREHRPHRAALALPDPVVRAAGVGRGPGAAARAAGGRRRGRPHRRGRAARRPLPAREAHGVPGRRLDPGRRRGHRPAGRARPGVGERVAASPRRRWRASWSSSPRCASASRCWRACRSTAVEQVRSQLVLTRGARTLRAHAQAAGVHAGDRVGRVHRTSPTTCSASSGWTTPSPTSSRSLDGRLTGRLLGPVVDRAGKADALARFAAAEGVPLVPDGRDRRRRERPRHAGAGGAGHRLQRQAAPCGRRPTPRVTSPTSTRSSSCWGSPARRSRPPTPTTPTSRWWRRPRSPS